MRDAGATLARHKWQIKAVSGDTTRNGESVFMRETLITTGRENAFESLSRSFKSSISTACKGGCEGRATLARHKLSAAGAQS
jgi:hypothetical protein